jgi:hypothetical protein
MRPVIHAARLAGLALLLAVAVGACRQATPTPVPTTPTVSGALPTLAVERAVVKYRHLETDTLAEVKPGESVEAGPGGNVVVDAAGRGSLTWPQFLRNELLADADTLISLSEPNSRRAILDQAAGLARYTVEGSGEPTDLQVNAGFLGVGKSVAAIAIAVGPADFIVSVDPGDKPSVWVAMVDGNAKVTRGGDTLELGPGTVATFTAEGRLVVAQPLDATALGAWYASAAAGQAVGGLASVAFRCTVKADAPLRGTASAAGATTTTLPKGTVVTVVGRSGDGAFVSVRADGDAGTGWVAKDALECSALLDLAPVVSAGGTVTPTRTLVPRGTPTRTPTARPPGTTTATATATAAAYTFTFGVSPETIEAGDCATLKWEVTGVQSVYLDGSGVAGGTQTKKVCPDETTTYTMEVVKVDGTRESKSVTVKVQPAATQPVQPTTTTPPTLPPQASDTPVPPTEQPTPEPQPTNTTAAVRR